MQLKTLLQRLLSAINKVGFFGIFGILSFLVVLIFFTSDLSDWKSYMNPAASVQSIIVKKQPRFGFPARIKIPRIKVDAPFEYVGITSDGVMDIPKVPGDVAWFNLGPRPGDRGSAVISGHYGWKNGIPAVFDNLSKLRKGDKIYVEDEKGATTAFVVRESRTYGESQDALDVFASRDVGAHLNLVTCQGVWNKNKKSYSNRLVVFADKEVK